MDLTLADIIKKRIELRDEIARIKKLQDEELKPAYRACEALDGMMLDYFSREGCKRLATDSGTAYKKISYKVKMLDREEFRSWVIDEERWHAADIKPNKTYAVEYLDGNKKPPPGINVDGRFTVGYRKSGEPEDDSEELE